MLVGRNGSQERVPRLYAWVSQLGAGLWDRDRPWAHELSTEKTSQLLELGARSTNGPMSTGNQASHSNPELPGRERGPVGITHIRQPLTKGAFSYPLLYPGKAHPGSPGVNRQL